MSQQKVLQLRDYQQQAVDAAIHYFRHQPGSAVIVLPTGAGKSIVIAELARIARGRVLILTHVKELVAQNADKASLLTDDISIYSAGLKQKISSGKTVVAGIQSAARNPQAFMKPFSLVIIDECHRVSDEEFSQYQQLLKWLQQHNPKVHLLGLTATPYRLGSGWIYKRHYHGRVGNVDTGLFDDCIFELPLRLLIKQGYLTPPRLLDGLSAQYNFSQLRPDEQGNYQDSEVDALLQHCGRATTAIVKQLMQLAVSRRGVIIFAATVRHAEEIMSHLPKAEAALITAKTATTERDQIIVRFKQQQLKFLVNVAVLTTGFDAPHVDLIAIMRPTASVALFQQMVGRGLRLSDGKQDCLIIDYAANGFDLFSPQIALPRPAPDTEPVQVICPECGFANIFWGKTNEDGEILEHFGRRCQGLIAAKPHPQQCRYRFRARFCPDCGAENDIAARECSECHSQLVDPDKRLKEVLAQRHHHLFRVQQMQLRAQDDKLLVEYSDIDANHFSEQFRVTTLAQRHALFARFIYPHDRRPGLPLPSFSHAEELLALASRFRVPALLLLKKQGKHWVLLEKFFDYQGRYQTENHNA
ncbi:DEAD/DEAH box helicase [Shewanella fodinae]|uniref:DNA repair protein RadD n=1 Tax=Shewanella fodinae TaxID=552357 RepID=A0A4R2FLH1_9GAMM|nr:DEAD/DEAH box helicase [Shewanella fodinae]TCN85021.1 DNA repair protein RadD [Shewanella fodinae]